MEELSVKKYQKNQAKEQLTKYLQYLETYLNDLWQFIPLPLSYINPQGIILEANQPLGQFLSKKPEDLIGQHLSAILQDQQRAKILHQEILKNRKISQELSLISPQGEKIVKIWANVRIDEKSQVIGYYLALSDITELKKLQKELEQKVKERTQKLAETVQELRNSRKALLNILEDVEQAKKQSEQEQAKVKAIIDNFTDALLFFDQNKILQIFNPNAELLFRINSSEILRKNIQEIKEPPALAKVLEKVRIKKEFRRQELQTPEGRTFEVTSIIVTKDGVEIGTLILIHDITREKRVERLKSEFVSIAAHQLRTPLSAIKWTLKMLLDGDLGRLTKEQLEFVEKTYQSNERMITLINDLLNVTRIEEGRYIYEKTPCKLETLSRQVIEAFQEEILRKKIRFGLLLPKEELPSIYVDQEKIKLVIQNLLDNAIKYTPAGGSIVISISRPTKDKIEFAIKDTGVGIPSDQQDRVFSRFFRGANILRLETTGTGLGLFIAKNIVEAHGGQIWFESKENQGTTFHFTLPIASQK